jgi:hypothetical protein
MAGPSTESRAHVGAGRGREREGTSPARCSGGRQCSGVDKDGAVAAPPAARTTVRGGHFACSGMTTRWTCSVAAPGRTGGGSARGGAAARGLDWCSGGAWNSAAVLAAAPDSGTEAHDEEGSGDSGVSGSAVKWLGTRRSRAGATSAMARGRRGVAWSKAWDGGVVNWEESSGARRSSCTKEKNEETWSGVEEEHATVVLIETTVGQRCSPVSFGKRRWRDGVETEREQRPRRGSRRPRGPLQQLGQQRHCGHGGTRHSD